MQIANRIEAQVTSPDIPLRNNAAEKVGASDHWPVVLSIEPIEKQ